MNRFAQSTSAFAMNNADIKDSPLPAFRKIMRNQLFYFTGIKCMEHDLLVLRLKIFAHLENFDTIEDKGLK